jgi:uncharacterized membrane-anchored protein
MRVLVHVCTNEPFFDLATDSPMLRKFLPVALLFATISFFTNVNAATGSPDKKITAEEFLASLHFQTGRITLPGGIATLDMPDSFRYLPPQDATRLLVEGWGNPPGGKTLGMILPADVSPLSANGWAVDVSFDKDGHVKDDDATSIKYDELLKTMQESIKDNNEARKKDGYPEMTLVGWAEQPSYDNQSHKLYWAKEIKFADSPVNTLNYNVRVLGRDGVLVLNAIAGMGQIGQIKSEMQHVTAFTDFTTGNRYTDFDSKTDKVAEYGIAALVAGGVAAKLGLFGKLFALLLAAKKVIFLALAGIGGAIVKFFKREKAE